MGLRGPKPSGPSVEACDALDADRAVRDWRAGDVRAPEGGVPHLFVDGRVPRAYVVRADERGGEIDLFWARGGEAARQRVRLRAIHNPVGGTRWYAACAPCGRNAGKLYLPPGGDQFACRACHGLRYTSSRHSGDKNDRFDRKMARLAGCRPRDMRQAINRYLLALLEQPPPTPEPQRAYKIVHRRFPPGPMADLIAEIMDGAPSKAKAPDETRGPAPG